jgi:TonB family protein
MTTLYPQTLPQQPESTLELRRHQADSNRYLPLLLTASILIHEGLLLLFMGDPWLLSKAAPNSEKQIPIEFVGLDPQQAAQEPPPETDRVALYNSQAQADISPESSEASGQPSERSSSQSLEAVPQRFEDSAEYARSQIRPDQASQFDEVSPVQEPTANVRQSAPSAQFSSPKAAATDALDLPPLDPDGLVAKSGHSNAVLPRATPLASPQRSSSAALGGGGQVGLNSQAPSLYSTKNDRSGTGQGSDARQDVNLGPYLSRLKSKVEGAWSPNTNSSYSQVVLHFSIFKNGTLSNLNIAQSSGQSAIDQAALNAVQQASAGFEPLPEGYQRDALHIEFTFTVRAGSANILH